MNVFNQKLFLYLNSFAGQSEVLDSAVVFTAETLGIVLLIALVVFLLSHEHTERSGFFGMMRRGVGKGFHNIIVILASGAIAWGVARLIKTGFPVDRPFDALDSVVPLFEPSSSGAFPSAHAAFFAATATALYFYHKKLGVIFFVLAIAIGIARIVSGVHWPVDIVGGLILGMVIAIFIYRLYALLMGCKKKHNA
ncbi:MAG TPA: phosphatase PAP2 family protein [Candidatus Yonathbacteria bacterium]|nr:phosphatase PAP2 family protein [Candidatus Yonathbacteria bacterium]